MFQCDDGLFNEAYSNSEKALDSLKSKKGVINELIGINENYDYKSTVEKIYNDILSVTSEITELNQKMEATGKIMKDKPGDTSLTGLEFGGTSFSTSVIGDNNSDATQSLESVSDVATQNDFDVKLAQIIENYNEKFQSLNLTDIQLAAFQALLQEGNIDALDILIGIFEFPGGPVAFFEQYGLPKSEMEWLNTFLDKGELDGIYAMYSIAERGKKVIELEDKIEELKKQLLVSGADIDAINAKIDELTQTVRETRQNINDGKVLLLQVKYCKDAYAKVQNGETIEDKHTKEFFDSIKDLAGKDLSEMDMEEVFTTLNWYMQDNNLDINDINCAELFDELIERHPDFKGKDEKETNELLMSGAMYIMGGPGTGGNNDIYNFLENDYKWMTDADRQAYSFAIASGQGKEFLDTLEKTTLQKRQGIASAHAKMAHLENYDGDWRVYFETGYNSLASGLAGAIEDIGDFFTGDLTYSANEYEMQEMALMIGFVDEASKKPTKEESMLFFVNLTNSNLSEKEMMELEEKDKNGTLTYLDMAIANGSISGESAEICKALKEDGVSGKGLNFASNVGGAVGRMLPSIVVGMATGGTLGAPLMALSSAGGTAKQMRRDGYSTAEAYQTGITNAAIEATLETFLGAIPGVSRGTGFLDDVFRITALDSKALKVAKFVAKNFVVSPLSEGFQEVLEDKVTGLATSVITGDDYVFSDGNELETFLVSAASSMIINLGTAPITISQTRKDGVKALTEIPNIYEYADVETGEINIEGWVKKVLDDLKGNGMIGDTNINPNINNNTETNPNLNGVPSLEELTDPNVKSEEQRTAMFEEEEVRRQNEAEKAAIRDEIEAEQQKDLNEQDIKQQNPTVKTDTEQDNKMAEQQEKVIDEALKEKQRLADERQKSKADAEIDTKNTNPETEREKLKPTEESRERARTKEDRIREERKAAEEELLNEQKAQEASKQAQKDIDQKSKVDNDTDTKNTNPETERKNLKSTEESRERARTKEDRIREERRAADEEIINERKAHEASKQAQSKDTNGNARVELKSVQAQNGKAKGGTATAVKVDTSTNHQTKATTNINQRTETEVANGVNDIASKYNLKPEDYAARYRETFGGDINEFANGVVGGKELVAQYGEENVAAYLDSIYDPNASQERDAKIAELEEEINQNNNENNGNEQLKPNKTNNNQGLTPEKQAAIEKAIAAYDKKYGKGGEQLLGIYAKDGDLHCITSSEGARASFVDLGITPSDVNEYLNMKGRESQTNTNNSQPNVDQNPITSETSPKQSIKSEELMSPDDYKKLDPATRKEIEKHFPNCTEVLTEAEIMKLAKLIENTEKWSNIWSATFDQALKSKSGVDFSTDIDKAGNEMSRWSAMYRAEVESLQGKVASRTVESDITTSEIGQGSENVETLEPVTETRPSNPENSRIGTEVDQDYENDVVDDGSPIDGWQELDGIESEDNQAGRDTNEEVTPIPGTKEENLAPSNPENSRVGTEVDQDYENDVVDDGSPIEGWQDLDGIESEDNQAGRDTNEEVTPIPDIKENKPTETSPSEDLGKPTSNPKQNKITEQEISNIGHEENLGYTFLTTLASNFPQYRQDIDPNLASQLAARYERIQRLMRNLSQEYEMNGSSSDINNLWDNFFRELYLFNQDMADAKAYVASNNGSVSYNNNSSYNNVLAILASEVPGYEGKVKSYDINHLIKMYEQMQQQLGIMEDIYLSGRVNRDSQVLEDALGDYRRSKSDFDAYLNDIVAANNNQENGSPNTATEQKIPTLDELIEMYGNKETNQNDAESVVSEASQGEKFDIDSEPNQENTIPSNPENSRIGTEVDQDYENDVVDDGSPIEGWQDIEGIESNDTVEHEQVTPSRPENSRVGEDIDQDYENDVVDDGSPIEGWQDLDGIESEDNQAGRRTNEEVTPIPDIKETQEEQTNPNTNQTPSKTNNYNTETNNQGLTSEKQSAIEKAIAAYNKKYGKGGEELLSKYAQTGDLHCITSSEGAREAFVKLGITPDDVKLYLNMKAQESNANTSNSQTQTNPNNNQTPLKPTPINENTGNQPTHYKRFSKNATEGVKELGDYYGDAGRKIKEMLVAGKSIKEVYNSLPFMEKLSFYKFLHTTTEGNFLRSLTPMQLRALTIYTGGSYNLINSSLRNQSVSGNTIAFTNSDGSISEVDLSTIIDEIDEGLKVFGGLDEPTVLYRAVDIEAFRGQNSFYAPFFESINSTDTDAIYATLKTLEGQEFGDLGYMSASPCYGTSFAKMPSYNIVLEIEADAGTPGAYINQISSFYNLENEFLMARDTKLEMQEVYRETDQFGYDKIVVKCKVKQNTPIYTSPATNYL